MGAEEGVGDGKEGGAQGGAEGETGEAEGGLLVGDQFVNEIEVYGILGGDGLHGAEQLRKDGGGAGGVLAGGLGGVQGGAAGVLGAAESLQGVGLPGENVVSQALEVQAGGVAQQVSSREAMRETMLL